jgi:putative sporulation protein YyaC
MAGNENVFKGITLGKFKDHESLTDSLNKHIKTDDVYFFCVGTDRSSGDSFAPFVGTYLTELGYKNVLGTIDEPVHGQNLDEMIKLIPEGKLVIAIDACLGQKHNIGKLILKSGSLYAGAGVDKDLTPVGDFHIAGVVNVDANDKMINYQLLAGTRLSEVIKMAKTCTVAIEKAFPLHSKVTVFEREII